MIFLWPGFIELKLMRAASQPLFTAFCIHHYHYTCVCLWSILMGQYLVCNKHEIWIWKYLWNAAFVDELYIFFIHLLKSHVSSQSSKVTSTNKTNSFKKNVQMKYWVHPGLIQSDDALRAHLSLCQKRNKLGTTKSGPWSLMSHIWHYNNLAKLHYIYLILFKSLRDNW